MRRIIALLLMPILFVSCEDIKSEQDLPSKDQTLQYLTQEINGHTINGNSFSVINPQLSITGNNVTYTFQNKFVDSDYHWKLTHKFSLEDIEYVSGGSGFGVSYVDLNMKNRSSQETVTSLNGLPLPSHVPPVEMKRTVGIYVSSSDFDKVKKAFNHLLELRRKENGADFFENN